MTKLRENMIQQQKTLFSYCQMIVCELCTNCSELAQLEIQIKKKEKACFFLLIEEPINHTTSYTEYALS